PLPLGGGAPPLADMLAGQSRFSSGPAPGPFDQIGVEKRGAWGEPPATGLEVLPDIPTMAQFLPGYEASFWFDVGAPRNTPAEIIEKLNREINSALADPRMKVRLAELGGTILAGSSDDFGKLIADETDKWGKVIRAANIKAD